MNLDTGSPSVLRTIRDEFSAAFRMAAGLAIIFCCGWLPIGLTWFAAKSRGYDPRLAAACVAIASLFLFLKLERNFWLSRFMGLPVGPRSQPWFSSLFLWAFGIAGMLVRSAGPPSTIVDEPGTTPRPATPAKAVGEPAVKDSFREVVETVVFVVVLVLMLKSFVAEAFVIPTGSMAETLLGYQRFVTCAKCGQYFPVNSSSEVDPQQGDPIPVLGCTCPNCRYREVWREYEPPQVGLKQIKDPPPWNNGDRVLVAKFPYDGGSLKMPGRFDVVVFKYPSEPQKSNVAMNYIKRLIGLPGETIAIYNGDVFVNKSLQYPAEAGHAPPEDPMDTWRHGFSFLNDEAALKAFRERDTAASGFEILRKSPETMLAMRRIVYDNDHQATDLVGKAKPRWQFVERSGWAPDKTELPRTFRHAGTSEENPEWLRYQHLIVDRSSTQMQTPFTDIRPSLIRNFMGYNTASNASRGDSYWVGDLMLECTVDVEQPAGELLLELGKSADKFQVKFDLRTGKVSLLRSGTAEPVKESAAGIKGPGSYRLRFADFDDRLTLWINDNLVFGDGVNVPHTPPVQEHPNNLDPAGIGVARGAKLTVKNIALWRDTYYTLYPEGNASDGVQTRYIHPGHFFCLGDNSSESSDSRFWGMVPERLMLGRALLVYWPLTRAGLIR